MISNYFKIAVRNLWRAKGFSAINIFGLSAGIATCLLIVLFIQNELSFDRYNKKADQIVRVVFRSTVDGQQLKEANVMPPVAKTLLAEFPEVREATRLQTSGPQIIGFTDKKFKEDAFAFVDPNFFEVFTLPFIKGNAATALQQPNTIVITQAVAHKYFGAGNPIGKELTIKGAGSRFRVAGVIKEVPANSHFHFDFFASMENVPDSKSASFMTSGYFTYLVLQQNYDYKKLEAKLPQVIDKYLAPQLQQGIGLAMPAFRQNGNDLGLYLQPLTHIHLHSDCSNDLEPAGDIRYVYIFGAVALFMLVIACINFMNLSTAGASKRAREVGIRKVLGSGRGELIRQFLAESILLTAIAFMLAIVLVYIALPFFNNISGKDLAFRPFSNPWVLPSLFLFGLITGIVAGSYPAFFLSSFKPVKVLKGKFTSDRKSIGLRSALVVFQFFISIILIVSTAVVYRQLRYIQDAKLGYDKEQVIVLPETWLLGKNQPAFYNKIIRDPRILGVSVSGYLPAGNSYGNNFFVYPGNDKTRLVKTLRYDIDYNYLSVLGMKMVEGRNFSPDFGADSSGIILNETAAKAFGWSHNALGKTVSTGDKLGIPTRYQVIGVVKDFHFKSLHETISPLVMVLNGGAGTMILKVAAKDISGILHTLKTAWASLSPDGAMSYSFLDDRVNETYRTEHKMGLILGVFAGLTIFVACLGLFGLATFTAGQRTKEIGIRKVLGATVSGLVSMLSKDFLRLVLIAFVMAAPVAWLMMSSWLQDFAYRIHIGWWTFIAAAIAVVLITVVTVSFQAIKAAVANPVKSLRTE